VRYALDRAPDGWRLGDADVAGSAVAGPAARRLDAALRDAVAGQADAVPALAEFGVSMLVVPDRDTAGLERLAEIDGLDSVPTTQALVWRSAVPTGEVVMLGPTVATTVSSGADLPADAVPHPLAAGEGSSRATVPAGRSGRLLVLAESADSHWRATLDGRPLPSTTAYGWAQAWRLPATGGRLDLGRSGDHRGGWVLLQLALLVTALVLSLPTGAVRHRGEHAA
jgi:hypothetical protein